jgi:hypothetical protein
MNMFRAIACLLFLQSSLWGQGYVVFSNVGGTDAQKIYETPGVLAPGGTKYSLGLYYAPDGVTDESVFVMLGQPIGIAGAAGNPSGLFSGGSRSAPTATAGGFGMFQVRGWESAMGGSYEQAAINPLSTCLGKSPIVRIDTDPAVPGASLINGTGFQGFVLCVPEPSTYALAGLGIAIAMFLRRRRG